MIENENDVIPINEKISLTEVMTNIRALKSEVQELHSQFQVFIKHQQNTPTVCVRVEGAAVHSSFSIQQHQLVITPQNNV